MADFSGGGCDDEKWSDRGSAGSRKRPLDIDDNSRDAKDNGSDPISSSSSNAAGGGDDEEEQESMSPVKHARKRARKSQKGGATVESTGSMLVDTLNEVRMHIILAMDTPSQGRLARTCVSFRCQLTERQATSPLYLPSHWRHEWYLTCRVDPYMRRRFHHFMHKMHAMRVFADLDGAHIRLLLRFNSYTPNNTLAITIGSIRVDKTMVFDYEGSVYTHAGQALHIINDKWSGKKKIDDREAAWVWREQVAGDHPDVELATLAALKQWFKEDYTNKRLRARVKQKVPAQLLALKRALTTRYYTASNNLRLAHRNLRLLAAVQIEQLSFTTRVHTPDVILANLVAELTETLSAAIACIALRHEYAAVDADVEAQLVQFALDETERLRADREKKQAQRIAGYIGDYATKHTTTTNDEKPAQ